MARLGMLLAVTVSALVLAISPAPALAGGNSETLTRNATKISSSRWDSHAMPVSWLINDQGVANNTNNGNATNVSRDQAVASLKAAFDTWQSVSTSSIAFTYAGLTSEGQMGLDGENVVTWTDPVASGSGIAALTVVFSLTAELTVGPSNRDLNLDGQIDLSPALYPDGTVLRAGTIIDSDIAFNASQFDWVTTPITASRVVDIQAIAVHEIGHFHGLSHSSLGDPNPTMFPFFTTTTECEHAMRTLEADDVASTSRCYPEGNFANSFGAIEGRVYLGGADGTPADGVGVYAVNAETMKPVVEVFSVSRFTDSSRLPGSFKIDGLPPGRYLVGARYFDGADERGLFTNLYNVTIGRSNVCNGNAFSSDFFGLNFAPRPQWANGEESVADDLSPASVFEVGAGSSVSGLRLVVNTSPPPRALGYTPLNLGRADSKPVFFSSGFSFSFFDTTYDRVYVGSNGYLTFGGTDTNATENVPAFLGPLPRIAALFDNLNPIADGVDGTVDAFLRQTSDELDILYSGVPESVSCPSNTFEIRLRHDGSITIEYDYLRSLDAIAGITPGGSSPASHVLDFTSALTYHGARNEAIYEAFTGPLSSPPHCVDLGACTLRFTPNANHGYDLDVTRPGSTTGTALEVRSVDPSSGPEAGGQRVTVRGVGFGIDAVVTFGGSMATTFAVVDAGTIRCKTPPGTGTVDVTVSSGGNTDSLVNGYRYVPPPALSSVAPPIGPESGGTRVTISGRHLHDVTVVRFGSSRLDDMAIVDDSTITGATPPGTGTVAVSAESAGGATSLPSAFTYNPPPALTGLTPTNGPERGGNHVTLVGRNFTRTADTRVFFGDHEATSVNVTSPTSIDVDAPAGRGIVNVRVDESFGSSTLRNAYTYNPPPTLASVSPASGPEPGGTSVTIRGTNFTRTEDTRVAFGETLGLNLVVRDSTTITAQTPPGTGIVDVRVTNSNGDASRSHAFTYLQPPSLASLSPTMGPTSGGTAVTLHGTHFSPADATTVQFGGVSATEVHVLGPETITCITPAGTGSVDVSVANSNGRSTLASVYTYTNPQDIACRRGNVNEHGDGGIVDVLFVNGSAGGDMREVRVGRHDSITVTMAATPNVLRSRFCAYIWRGRPTGSSAATQPFNLGDMCMPTPLNDESPQPMGILNNLGYTRLLGRSTMSSEPAPSTLFSLPTGTHGRSQFFVQAFIEDPTAPTGLSITNGIQVLTD